MLNFQVACAQKFQTKNNICSHDLGAVTIFRFSELELGLGLG